MDVTHFSRNEKIKNNNNNATMIAKERLLISSLFLYKIRIKYYLNSFYLLMSKKSAVFFANSPSAYRVYIFT